MKEPEQACPLIDKTIKNFDKSKGYISDICESLAKCEALKESANNILYWLEQINFAPTLEELRSKCSDLREWGSNWQAKAEKLKEELEESKEKLND